MFASRLGSIPNSFPSGKMKSLFSRSFCQKLATLAKSDLTLVHVTTGASKHKSAYSSASCVLARNTAGKF